MLRPLHIIASCTDRKRLRPADDLRLREITATDPRERLIQWWGRLKAFRGETLPAVELYLGGHWAVVRDLARPHVAFRTRLWVASAGYGLVPVSARLHPYSATFGSGHPDSVSRGTRGPDRFDLLRSWWDTLNELPGPERLEPRKIAELAQKDRQACILVVASPNYVCAIENDLVEAAKELADPDRLVIVCSRSHLFNGALLRHMVLSDARLQATLRGARQSLNARLARDILELSARLAKDILENAPYADLSAEWLRAHYGRMITESEPAPRYDRQRMTDEEVKQFIREALAQVSQRTVSRLLRELRDSSRACEQKRFKELFHKVRQEIRGQVHAA